MRLTTMVAALAAAVAAIPAQAAVTIGFEASGTGSSSLYGDLTGDRGARLASASGTIAFDPVRATSGGYRFDGVIEPYSGVTSTIIAQITGDTLNVSFSRPFHMMSSQTFDLTVNFAAGYLSGGFPAVIDFSRVVSSGLSVGDVIRAPRQDIVTFDGVLTSLTTRQTNRPVGASVVLTNVAAVPEPATWGLMILGFGATGHAVRRRRAAVRAA